jgi:hypothetical protein
MIQYHPIDCGYSWDSTLVELRCFDWLTGTSEWDIPGEPPGIMSVRFSGILVVRILDEFFLSTETSPDQWGGLVRDHFAYWVEGDSFYTAQPSAWTFGYGSTKHYRLITGNACLDVISTSEPEFYFQYK